MHKFEQKNQTKNEISQFTIGFINILFGILNLYITTKFLESWQLNQYLFFLILGSLISIFYNRISLTFTRLYASSFNKIDRANTDTLLGIKKSSEIYLIGFGAIYAIIFLIILNLSEFFNINIFENMIIALLIIFSFFFRSSYIYFQGTNKNYFSNYSQCFSSIFVTCLILLSIFYCHSMLLLIVSGFFGHLIVGLFLYLYLTKKENNFNVKYDQNITKIAMPLILRGYVAQLSQWGSFYISSLIINASYNFDLSNSIMIFTRILNILAGVGESFLAGNISLLANMFSKNELKKFHKLSMTLLKKISLLILIGLILIILFSEFFVTFFNLNIYVPSQLIIFVVASIWMLDRIQTQITGICSASNKIYFLKENIFSFFFVTIVTWFSLYFYHSFLFFYFLILLPRILILNLKPFRLYKILILNK